MNQFLYSCKTNQHESIHKVKINFYKTLSKGFVQNNFIVFQNSFQLSKSFQLDKIGLRIVRLNLNNHTYKGSKNSK